MAGISTGIPKLGEKMEQIPEETRSATWKKGETGDGGDWESTQCSENRTL